LVWNFARAWVSDRASRWIAGYHQVGVPRSASGSVIRNEANSWSRSSAAWFDRDAGVA